MRKKLTFDLSLAPVFISSSPASDFQPLQENLSVPRNLHNLPSSVVPGFKASSDLTCDSLLLFHIIIGSCNGIVALEVAVEAYRRDLT